MNWDAVGAIAEGIGAFGVIASLLYLSTQLRQNTQSIRDATIHEVVRDYANAGHVLNADPELVAIFYKGLKDFESLTESESQRFATVMGTSLRLFENLIYQAERGRLDKDAVQGLYAHFEWVIRQSGFRQWWVRGSTIFSRDFVDYISAFLARDVKPGATLGNGKSIQM